MTDTIADDTAEPEPGSLLAALAPACRVRVRQIMAAVDVDGAMLLALPTEDEDDGGFVLEYTLGRREMMFAVAETGHVYFSTKEQGGTTGRLAAGVVSDRRGDATLAAWLADGNMRDDAGLTIGTPKSGPGALLQP